MTTLGAKMSYPGMSSSYQSYHQPVRHQGLNNGHHISSSDKHNSRITTQQQQSVVPHFQPALLPAAPPITNTQENGDRWLHGVSLAQKSNKEDSPTTIKSEPLTNTEMSPSQANPPVQSSPNAIVNNGTPKLITPHNAIRLPAGARQVPQPPSLTYHTQARPPAAFPQPHGMANPPNPQIPRTWIPNSARAPGGVYPQARTAVNPQTVRTWIPVRPPFIENSPRVPGSSVLTPRPPNNHLKTVQKPSGSWVVPKENFLSSSAIFKKADTNNDGYVSGLEVRDIFIRTGLSQENLIHIWDLVDTKQEGRLNCEQFALAMWITSRTAYSNIPPPKKLTPEMIPPSMRVKASPPTNKSANRIKVNEIISSPNTLLSNIMHHGKNGRIPKPPILEKHKKVKAKISRPGQQPIDDVFACPHCSLIYDDSQHSPRQLPCSHTFCIDCIDQAIDQDSIKCFTCNSSHIALAAADFPVNAFTVELLKRYIAGKSEEERKKYLHDAEACFNCVSDFEPPLKRAKVGEKHCDNGSSQERESTKGCDIDKINEISSNIIDTSKSRISCNEPEINSNSVSVLENSSPGKENDSLSTQLKISSIIGASSSSNPSIVKNSTQVNLNINERKDYNNGLSYKEKYLQNPTNDNINKEDILKTKENECDITRLVMQNNNLTNHSKENASKPKEAVNNTTHSEMQNKWLNSIQAREKATENQRAKPREPSKTDENMNSLSVDKFLEEIL